MTSSDEKRIEAVLRGLAEVAATHDAADVVGVLNRHPELLTDRVNDTLTELVERLKHDDPPAAEFLERAATVLRNARTGDVPDADVTGLASYAETQDAIKRANDLYLTWISTGADRDLDAAISSWDSMLNTAGQLAPPEEIARLQVTAARLVAERGSRTGALSDMQRAEELAAAALAGVPPGSPGRPDVVNAAAVVSWLRYQVTGSAEDLDRAVTAFDEAAAGAPDGTPEKPGILGNLAMALHYRAVRTGSLPDLQRAVAYFRAAVDQTPRDSAEFPQRLAGLAAALGTLSEATNTLEPLDEAIASLRTGATMARPGSASSVATLTSLGRALGERYNRTGDPATLSEAIAILERATAESGPEGPWRARCVMTLGLMFIERYARTQQPSELHHGEALLREALALSPTGSTQADSSLYTLANALARASDVDHEVSTRSLASAAYHEAATATASQVNRMRTAEEWGRWAANAGDWADAATAYRTGLDAWMSAVGSGEADHAGFPWDIVATLPARAAFALAVGDHPGEAVLALEQGRWLQVPRRPGIRPASPPTPADLAAATPDAPVAYLLSTERGGLALVVSGPAPEAARSVWLPELGEEPLRRRIIPYLSEADRRRTLDDLTNWLWSAVMDPVLAAAAPAAAARLTLIPVGLLALLPLHAAWEHDEGLPTGRRYAIDDHTITYAPSLRVLAEACLRARGQSADDILAVTNPGPGAEALPGAAGESEIVSRWFADCTMLTGQAATRQAVLAAIGQHDVVHFACPGTSDLTDSDLNVLMMADGQALHPPDIRELNLDSARLVVLSASESGVPGTEPAKEARGWPGAFLAAGAAGVIASLWGVPDEASMLLMARFYYLWRKDGLDPADALRGAQRWLRDSTNREKAAFFDQNSIPFPKRPPATGRSLWEEGRSDASPARWAGFAYFGA